MTLSKDKKQKLKKLKTAKYNPTKGLDSALFSLVDNNSNEGLAVREPTYVQYKLAPLPPVSLQSCMDLFEENMGKLYRDSSWGLDLGEKRTELDHNDARFLLVTTDDENSDKKPILGYCHFRFDTDDDEDPEELVVYVYELQVSKHFQGHGIGRRLMEIVHEVTKKAGLTKVMLTVFDANEEAVRFYNKLGYAVDEDHSPGDEEDFKIMSKTLL
jgi:ribosomal protein S18 acetylase RimI-like enzyme